MQRKNETQSKNKFSTSSAWLGHIFDINEKKWIQIVSDDKEKYRESNIRVWVTLMCANLWVNVTFQCRTPYIVVLYKNRV